jgi:cytidylate kinase
MVVAIDGPAGAGKSTVARRVAAALGFQYLNSGFFYRSISRAVLDSQRDPDDRAGVIEIASRCRFELREDHLYVNGQPVGDIQTDQIDHWSPIHSRIPEVRGIVNASLRALADRKDLIVEGRDMGTVVFPDAAIKIFLDASLEARARRRFQQGVSGLSMEQLRAGLEERDAIDRSKPVGRLRKARGAIHIDTSDLTIEQVCDRVVREIRKKATSNRETKSANELG